MPAEETVWMRTREVWLHAVDLDNGATFTDIPAPVLERLLKDITGAWKTRGTDQGLLLKVTGTDQTFGDTSAANPTIITGPLPAVVQWAAGRGTAGVTASGAEAKKAEPGANGPVPSQQVAPAPTWI